MIQRVAIVSDWCFPRRGGIETHILDLAANLARVGVSASILTSYPGKAEADGVRIERVPTPLLPGAAIACSPFLVRLLERHLSMGNYDLVHVHPSQVAPFCVAATLAAQRLNIPVVATFHSMMTVLAPIMASTHRWLSFPGPRVSITGVSTMIAGQIGASMPGTAIDILPNGYDKKFWHRRPGKDHAKSKPLLLVSALRLQSRKRPAALLDVFARALELAGPTADGASLTIAGEGPLKSGLIARAERLGLAPRIEFTDWLDKPALRDAFWKSDLFVMPSRKESFCIAALEARAAGLPVLGMTGTGMSDFIENEVNGLLVAGDAEMANAIAVLMKDRRRLEELAATEGNLAGFEWRELALRHRDFYAQVADVQSGST